MPVSSLIAVLLTSEDQLGEFTGIDRIYRISGGTSALHFILSILSILSIPLNSPCVRVRCPYYLRAGKFQKCSAGSPRNTRSRSLVTVDSTRAIASWVQ